MKGTYDLRDVKYRPIRVISRGRIHAPLSIFNFDYAPVVTVAAIEGDEVLLDANHPLAGMDLKFEVEIIAVRTATADELRERPTLNIQHPTSN